MLAKIRINFKRVHFFVHLTFLNDNSCYLDYPCMQGNTIQCFLWEICFIVPNVIWFIFQIANCSYNKKYEFGVVFLKIKRHTEVPYSYHLNVVLAHFFFFPNLTSLLAIIYGAEGVALYLSGKKKQKQSKTNSNNKTHNDSPVVCSVLTHLNNVFDSYGNSNIENNWQCLWTKFLDANVYCQVKFNEIGVL